MSRLYPTVTRYSVHYYDRELSHKGRGVQMRTFVTREEAEAFAAANILYAKPCTVETDEVPDVGPGTLIEELARRGYVIRPGSFGRQVILRGKQRGGELVCRRVAELTADACWKWLARRDAKLRAMAARKERAAEGEAA